jgi:hypothetical protein
MGCCRKPRVMRQSGAWWQTVALPQANKVVTFSSEGEAVRFLEAGAQRLSGRDDQELYRRLQWQRQEMLQATQLVSQEEE